MLAFREYLAEPPVITMHLLSHRIVLFVVPRGCLLVAGVRSASGAASKLMDPAIECQGNGKWNSQSACTAKPGRDSKTKQASPSPDQTSEGGSLGSENRQNQAKQRVPGTSQQEMHDKRIAVMRTNESGNGRRKTDNRPKVRMTAFTSSRDRQAWPALLHNDIPPSGGSGFLPGGSSYTYTATVPTRGSGIIGPVRSGLAMGLAFPPVAAVWSVHPDRRRWFAWVLPAAVAAAVAGGGGGGGGGGDSPLGLIEGVHNTQPGIGLKGNPSNQLRRFCSAS